MSKDVKDFKGYRLIIVDCKEEKIVVDDMITALVGGCTAVVNSETGLCAAKALALTRCSTVSAKAAIDAAEEAVCAVKESTLDKIKPGTMEKIKEMAAELAKNIFGGEDDAGDE